MRLGEAPAPAMKLRRQWDFTMELAQAPVVELRSARPARVAEMASSSGRASREGEVPRIRPPTLAQF